jgi:hypothetical protein
LSQQSMAILVHTCRGGEQFLTWVTMIMVLPFWIL